MPRPAAAAALLALTLSLPARAAEPEPLRLDLPVTLGATAAAGLTALLGVALEGELRAQRCRLCEPNAFDRWARDQLRWTDWHAAKVGSDLLLGAVPLGAAGALALSGFRAGGGRTALEDLAITAEAISVAVLATQVAKLAAGRIRPYAWADPASADNGNANLSFWSGHTATTFAAASAAGTVARLRGYRSWPWILGLGLAGAAATGWLRIAADRHWTTDVLVGAAVGSAAGFGLPVLLHGRRGASGSEPAGLQLTPAPFGIAGTF
jgi:membrane-associated phospholipid phosphatase